VEICGERVILAYADDIVVMGETRDEVMNTTSKPFRTSKSVGVRVNEDIAKYLMVTRRSPNMDYITVNNYRFEKMDVFRYLGVNTNSSNDRNYSNVKIARTNSMRSKLPSHNPKTHLYLNYLRPVVTYASETWSLTKGDGW